MIEIHEDAGDDSSAGSVITPKDTSRYRGLSYWLIIGVAFFSIYTFTGSQQYDADTLTELSAINNLRISNSDPTHMLYIRIGAPYYWAWKMLGYGRDAYLPMKILNAVFATTTILTLLIVLRMFQIDPRVAHLIGVTIGLSYAFWTHTSDAFFIIPACFFAVISLLCSLQLVATRSANRRAKLLVALGITFSLSVLTYQSNLFLLPALFVASFPSGECRMKMHAWNWTIIGGIALIVAGGGWTAQGVTAVHAHDAGAMADWFISSHGGIANGLWRREGVNLIRTVPIAWSATILPVYEGLRLRDLSNGVIVGNRVPAQIALALLAAGLTWAAALVIHNRRHVWRRLIRRRAHAVFLLWFVVPGMAVVWFDPAEVKLWLIPMLAFWMGLASVLSILLAALPARALARPLTMLLLYALALVVALGNFAVPVRPNHINRSKNMDLAKEAVARTTPRDLVISVEFDWTGYIAYLSQGQEVLNLIDTAQAQGKDAAVPTMRRQMDQTWSRGGHVYIIDVFEPGMEHIWSEWITRFTHLQRSDLDEYCRVLAWRTDGQSVWELLPTERCRPIAALGPT